MPDDDRQSPPGLVLADLVTAHLGQWSRRAGCAGHNPDLFFPPAASPGAEAKEICQRCPVTRECLDYSMRTDVKHGIWGGLNENERRSLRRKQARLRAAETGPA